MNMGEWITSAIAVLALVVSVIALSVALRSARGTASTGARTPEPPHPHEPQPSHEIVEPVPVAVAPPAPVGVAWRIEHDAGISWLLRNVGTEPAFDVHAVGSPPESAALVKVERSFADIPVGGTIGFHVVRTAHHKDVSGLEVTWGGQVDPVTVAMP